VFGCGLCNFVKPGYRNRYRDYDTGWTIQDSIPSRGQKFSCPPKRPDRLFDLPSFLFSVYWGLLSLVAKKWSLVPVLRMIRAIVLLPYAPS